MNKTVWMLWLQGWDKAPSISQTCVDSWKYYNPGWDVKLLDEQNVLEYLDIDEELPGLKTNNISLSNIIRISLIKKYGGVWADSTLFCNKSLDDWLPEGAFLFNRPSAQRMICDWFISGSGDSSIIDMWHNVTMQYWKWRIKETDQYEQHYGWSHMLFEKCYQGNELFKKTWDATQKIEASCTGIRGIGPHYFVPYNVFFKNKVSEEEIERIDSQVDPVYKLTYKIDTDWRNNGIHPGSQKIITPYFKKSSIDYLFNTIA